MDRSLGPFYFAFSTFPKLYQQFVKFWSFYLRFFSAVDEANLALFCSRISFILNKVVSRVLKKVDDVIIIIKTLYSLSWDLSRNLCWIWSWDLSWNLCWNLNWDLSWDLCWDLGCYLS